MTLIAEDLLLLLLDDQTGKPQTGHLEIALGGAVLVDLALQGLVEVATPGSSWRSAKLRRVPGSRSGDRVLAGALDAVVANQAAQRVVVKVGKGLVEPLAERQRERGVLGRREEKVLGLVTRTRWPSRDPSRKESIRRGLVVILVQGGHADARNASLIGLLLAVHRLHRIITHPDAGARALRRRAKEVAQEMLGGPDSQGSRRRGDGRHRGRALDGRQRRVTASYAREVTLIAEDLLLLLLDDESGKPQTSALAVALGGAVLVELALAEAVAVEAKTTLWRSAKVKRVPGAGASDPVLVDALATVGEKERSAQDLVTRLGKHLDEVLCTRLADRGILERRDDKVMGLFPRTRWPARDSSHEDAVRRALTVVLVDGGQPDARTGALVALLHAVDRAHKTVPHPGQSDRDLKKRAKEVAEGQWAAKAVKDAVAAAMAATTAAMVAATAVVTTGS